MGFYQSYAWRKLSGTVKAAAGYQCQICGDRIGDPTVFCMLTISSHAPRAAGVFTPDSVDPPRRRRREVTGT